MGKLFYSVSGEGRGHATRVLTIVEELRPDHDITVFAPDLAYDLLEEVYRDTEVGVRKIPGLGFSYSSENKLNYLKTGLAGLKSIRRFPGEIARLQRTSKRKIPTWSSRISTDPSEGRKKVRCSVHQPRSSAFFGNIRSELSTDISATVRHTDGAGRSSLLSGEARTIVSSFYFPPIRSRYKNVEQIGVLLRPEILEARRENGNHIVVYLRRFASSSVLDALADCGCEVRCTAWATNFPGARSSFARWIHTGLSRIWPRAGR